MDTLAAVVENPCCFLSSVCRHLAVLARARAGCRTLFDHSNSVKVDQALHKFN